MVAFPNHIPVEDVTPTNTEHVELHDTTTDALVTLQGQVNGLELADLADVDFSSPPVTGRQILLRDPATGHVILANDANPGGSYVAIAQVGAAGGVMGLDGSGNGTSPPQAHTHNVTVQDSGGTQYQRGRIDLYAGTGNVVDDAAGNRVKVFLTPADVRVLRLQSTSTLSVTNSTTLLELTDFTTPLVAGDAFDFELLLQITSTTAANAKLQVQGPIGSSMGFLHTGPAVSQTSFTPTAMRYATINIPTNGPQQIGGFGDTLAEATVRVSGSVQCPAGVSGNFSVKIGQVTATTDTTAAVAFHSKLILSRIS